MKPGTPLLRSTSLLDQVSERIRYMHYRLKTEKAYLYWVRFFIRRSATQLGEMRHPRDMGVADVEAVQPILWMPLRLKGTLCGPWAKDSNGP